MWIFGSVKKLCGLNITKKLNKIIWHCYLSIIALNVMYFASAWSFQEEAPRRRLQPPLVDSIVEHKVTIRIFEIP